MRMTTICFCSICCNWICHLIDYTHKRFQPLNWYSSMLIRMGSCSNYNNYLYDNIFISQKCSSWLVKLLYYKIISAQSSKLNQEEYNNNGKYLL